MIFNAADNQRWGIKIFARPCQVCMCFGSQGFIFQKGLSIFRGKDDVQIDLGEGLRNGESPLVCETPLGFGVVVDLFPRVALR